MGSNNDISLKALAKINLGLDVVRRREDGYHEVRMIMQTFICMTGLISKGQRSRAYRYRPICLFSL